MKKSFHTIASVLMIVTALLLGCKMGSNTLAISNEQISQALVENKTINNLKQSGDEIDFKNGIVDFTNKNIKYCFKVDEKYSAADDKAASIDLMLTSTEPQSASQDVRTAYGKVHLDLVKEGEKWRIKNSHAGELRIKTVSAKESKDDSGLTKELCSNFDSSKK